MTNLEFSQRKALSKAGTWAVKEGEEMAVSLDLILLSKVGLEPSFRVEFFGMGAPEPLGLVHEVDWDRDCRALGDGNTGDRLALTSNDRGA